MMRTTAFRLIAPVLAVLALAPGVRAADEAFSVSGIPVDKTAPSAAQARDSAIAEGQSLAWRRLVEKLALDTGAATTLTALPAREVAALVDGYQVEREQSSTVRYIGTMTYRFRPAAVRQVLRGNGISFTEGQSRPTVILPLLIEADGTRKLWEPNDWRQTWNVRPLRAGLVPLVLPRGTPEDVPVVDPATADKATANSAQMLLTRYGGIDLVVAVATFEPAGVTGTLRQGELVLANARVPQGPNDTREEALYRLAAELTAGLEARWKAERATAAPMPQPGGTAAVSANAFEARVPVSGLAEWQEVRRRLATIPAIRSVGLRALGPKEAVVSVDLAGSFEQARAALEARQLLMEPADDGWRLKFVGTLPTAPVPAPVVAPGTAAPSTAPVPGTPVQPKP